MNRSSRLCALVLAALAGGAAAQDDPELGTPAALPDGAPAGMEFVDRADLHRHAHHLAADELGGRYTATAGQFAAAEYIAKHFEELGLEPLGDKKRGKRTYFQRYPVGRTYLDPKKTSIVVGNETLKNGFAVIPGRGTKKVSASGLRFCAYGNPKTLPKSLKGKVPVVVLRSRGGGPRPGGVVVQQLGKSQAICRELQRRGAKLAVFCILDDDSGFGDRMNTSALLPGKPQLEFDGRKNPRNAQPMPLPAIFAPRSLSLKLFKALGVEQPQPGGEWVQKDPKKKAPGKVSLVVKREPKYEAVNVCAVLRGDGLEREAVVYSAHMDHMGTRMDGDAFNGADDNASGSSGLLDIAEAFAKGPKPKRSIVFLSVSGEELGLWGSEWYADHPTWKNIIANVNIDMIGRATPLSDAQQISVTPSYEHSKYSTIVRDAALLARRMGMSLTIGDTYYRRSDHYNFAKKGIPVVFFCDGEHADYHKVTDEADRLDFAKMERVARLAYWTGWEVANARGKPKDLGSADGWPTSRDP